VRDNWIVLPLPSAWHGKVVFGTSASQVIVAPFSLPAYAGQTEESIPIPRHRYLITIFDFGRRPVGYPPASRLSLRPFKVVPTNGTGSGKSFLIRKFRYKGISLAILANFADRKPTTGQLRAVESVVRRIRVSPT
jgi:hypothetical protein